MFQFDPSLLPSLTTRKALLVIDAQADFLSAEGGLPVTKPAGFMQRTIDVANAFRKSGKGDVIWVRSEFERHRPVESDQLMTSDTTVTNFMRRSAAALSARGARSSPEDDEEAFLSVPTRSPDGDDGLGSQETRVKPECVRAGTPGGAFASEIAATIDSARDSVLTKTHYSAFESGHLLRLLRGRFATEIYLCGVLTNISIHATALDAARHGLSMTLIDDCCGHRSPTRHGNAVRHLMQVTGCETAVAQDLISSLAPAPGAIPSRPFPPPSAGRPPGGSRARPIRTTSSPKSSPRESPKDKFVRDTSGRERPEPDSSHRDLSQALGGLKLSDRSPPAAKPDLPQPQADQQPVQPLVASRTNKGNSNTPRKPTDTANDAPSNPASQAQLEPELGEGAVDSESPKSPDQSGTTKSKGVDDTSSRQSPMAKKPCGGTPEPHPKDSDSTTDAATTEKSEEPLSTKEKQRKSLSCTQTESEMSSDDDVPVTKMKSGTRPSPSEPLCEGDTTVFHDVLPSSLEAGIFERLRDEVSWLRMSHQGGEVPRLVCVQGEVDEQGTMPVYRHPADESPPLVPFSPTVLEIKAEVEKLLGHSLNHVLIQFYRSGNDYISEHSDKTLDIVRDSFIANVSLGAERTMVFRTKRMDKDPSRKQKQGVGGDCAVQPTGEAGSAGNSRQSIRARLPHNSLCRMGLKTNERWLHAIRQDKRLAREKTPQELAFDGGRISLTFRQIGTFLDRDSSVIWGQGATSKTREGAQPVVNGQTEEAVRMLKAFGTENHSSVFDWDAVYGKGFDVLHMSAAPRFFSCGDAAVNLRIQLILAEYGVAYAKGSVGAGAEDRSNADAASGKGKEAAVAASTAANALEVRFVDNDVAKATVQGDMAVMLYLEAVHGPGKAGATATAPELARKFTRFQQALGLLEKWRAITAKGTASGGEEGGDEPRKPSSSAQALLKAVARDLAVFEAYVAETTAPEGGAAGAGKPLFIAGGDAPSAADFALWPVLREMAVVFDGGDAEFMGALRKAKLERLAQYYKTFGERKSVRTVTAGNVSGATS